MKHVSTEEFWQAMCHDQFVRTSHHIGRLKGEVLYTVTPPEDVPGFISAKIGCALEGLDRRPGLLHQKVSDFMGFVWELYKRGVRS